MPKNAEPYGRNEDHALFLLIKKRDKQAFTVIYQKYHRYLYALSLKYLKDGEMAEDAVQHVFVKLWDTTNKIDIEINLKNYLYTMTKNYILNKIRDEKEAVSLNYIQAQPVDEDEGILQAIEDREMIDLLYKGIDALPPQKREICIRKLQTSDSNQQIADKMGISLHTVKSHYQESLKMLRSYFQKIRLMLF
ncbi:MAG TPA: RNA polymerase subunit sigma-70 [Porphyromonadaceae bacterium]|jgi:RNA polymerase sigma-70 factor (ECF subfamily)|uniref:RNA polymerase sigma-70 factor n=1 Tax=Limibacterium fermenti TaxID=3229863 RepID=UPI000E857846|nr:RNA polymerase subunit sigma-70 [Porphyromonadaceae bacterium]HBL34785.1 RNA polymerase subunit sigma-70 [Porphyromonadaceae bacterium]HBX21427.1 RNA polymerase subunit sigma-70 [Porphyromonadaceae bacterium]HBX44937.1 RNA polymerase subunit sigma-70 [Porphyromonadaceae bacterium]HCM21924.1 RNA polymerase subunit sigma-70 [Porphyromonadaceae bacterium]